MSIQTERFGEIADAIRSYTGETGGIAPNSFAEKIGDVFRAGQAQAPSTAFELINEITVPATPSGESGSPILNIIDSVNLFKYNEFIIEFNVNFGEAHSGVSMLMQLRNTSGSVTGNQITIPSTNFAETGNRFFTAHLIRYGYADEHTIRLLITVRAGKPNQNSDNYNNAVTGSIVPTGTAYTYGMIALNPNISTVYTYRDGTYFRVYAR